MGKPELKGGNVEWNTVTLADGPYTASAFENVGRGLGVLVCCIRRQVGSENATVVGTAQYDADSLFLTQRQ